MFPLTTSTEKLTKAGMLDSSNSENHKLTDEAKHRSLCDQKLKSPHRLHALARTQLMDTPREAAFDRLAELAARILKVPLTIVSLVRDDKQFFKAAYGLPQPFDVSREIGIDGSICRYTLHGEPIIAEDASEHPLLKDHPSTRPWGIVAFIALPIFSSDGHVLGAFCAVDTKRREWTDDEIAIMQDLTASIMTEIEMRTQVAELEIERDLREQFVATLTHDLRTPMGVAKMAADLIRSDDSDAEEREKLSTMIINNMDRADQMIRDLLDASRIKAGEKVALELKECDLSQIVSAAQDTLTVLHGPRFKCSGLDALALGQWDEMAVQRMIENLGANAVKYGTHDRPVTISTKVTRDEVEISVHNWGNVIPPENLQNLFERYRRSQSAERGNQKGWGLGLTLVRGFAQAHGGSVQATSTAEAGTTFIVRLPRVTEAATQASTTHH